MLPKLLSIDCQSKVLFKTGITSTGPEQIILDFFTSKGDPEQYIDINRADSWSNHTIL